MTAARLATITAVGAALVWVVKAVAIGLAGGLGKSPAEGPLFFLGLVLAVVAASALGVALTSGRPTWMRVLGAAGVAIAAVMLVQLIGLVVGSMRPADPHWVWAEVELWISAVILVAATLAVRRRDTAVPTGVSTA